MPQTEPPGCIENLVGPGVPDQILFGTGAPARPMRPVLNMVLDAVGKDRVVFGTDVDLICPAFAMGVYHEADMSAEE